MGWVRAAGGRSDCMSVVDRYFRYFLSGLGVVLIGIQVSEILSICPVFEHLIWWE